MSAAVEVEDRLESNLIGDGFGSIELLSCG